MDFDKNCGVCIHSSTAAGEFCEHPDIVAAKEKELEGLREDAMTMALRLYGESDDTFAPETIEVMSRWRLKCNALFQEHADQKDKLYDAMERS